MKPFYFDIETLPAQDPEVRADIAASIKPPATYKKPESIAEWLAENRDKEAEAEWLKTSFDGGVGHVFCIAYAFGDEDPRVLLQPQLSRANEAAVLEVFFRDLAEAGHVQLVGHNVIGFDIPFLWKRAMVLGVRPPYNFPRNPKPWAENVSDTMLLWDATQRAGGSMDRLCKLLGIPGKGDFGGADVWPAIQRGEFDRVAEYCKGDVERTRAMFKRMTFCA